MSITIKSGGDRFTGNWYSDWEGGQHDQRQRARRVPNRQHSATRTASSCSSALARGNPIDRQYDINFNVGGPLWKRQGVVLLQLSPERSVQVHARHRRQLARSKLTNNYTFKGTFQLNRNNQVIGFLNKRNKLQELRDLAPPLVPISAARYQASRNYPWKCGVDERARQPRLPRRAGGQLVQFLPARPDR